MSSITIRKTDLTRLKADAIVNPANVHLTKDSGPCARIFQAAGPEWLAEECAPLGEQKIGDAVLTGGGHLPALWIIHAICPVWKDGKHQEPQRLYSCFQKALDLAAEKGARTIGFPLPAEGLYGYPGDKLCRRALQACNDWVWSHESQELEIIFCASDDHMLELGQGELKRQQGFHEKKVKEASAPPVDFEEGPYSVATEKALRVWLSQAYPWENSTPENDRQLHEAILQDVLADKHLLLPYTPTDEQKTWVKAHKEDRYNPPFPDDAYAYKLDQGRDTGSLLWFEAFTSRNRLSKTDRYVRSVSLRNLLEQICADERYCGVIFNPGYDSFWLNQNAIQGILKMAIPRSQDEINTELGEQAWQERDWETAAKYWQKAASSCNPTALSRLGDCWYSGRGVPADKEQARACWTRAAILGDARAVCQLGDMYRNGDLPLDIVSSRAFYWRAWNMICDQKDVTRYPDVCLRLVRHCAKQLSPEDILHLAEMAADGFQQRLEEGDQEAEPLRDEALALLQKAQEVEA